MGEIKLRGQKATVTGYIQHREFGTVPVVDLRMMTDLEWARRCLKSRQEYPELYRKPPMCEDVEAVIAGLRRSIAKWQRMEEDAWVGDTVQQIRRRVMTGGDRWPGKPVSAPASTRYPNILAELAARPYPNLSDFAEFAGVSNTVIVAALEDGELLEGGELYRLALELGVPAGYLAAPLLQTVDPGTNRGKVRQMALRRLIVQLEALGEKPEPGIRRTCNRLEGGEWVPYAEYSYSVKMLQEKIALIQRRRIPVRTERRCG